MNGSPSARQDLPTPPWGGEVGERSKNASRVGVKLNHPNPAARKMLAADPPRPGEGEARVMLSSEPITRIPYDQPVRQTLALNASFTPGATCSESDLSVARLGRLAEARRNPGLRSRISLVCHPAPSSHHVRGPVHQVGDDAPEGLVERIHRVRSLGRGGGNAGAEDFCA